MRLLPLALAALAIAGSAGARTVYVGNDGLDGAACGTKAVPCRSISQGIALAATGDTVLVGPGYYGDLDGDGMLGEPGEEGPTGFFIKVDKAVRVISRDGAAATYIDGTQPLDATPTTPVILEADGVTFGSADHGFTVANFPSGVAIFTVTPGATIDGNVVIGGHTGIVAGGGAAVADNRVLGAGFGITSGDEPNQLERNAAVASEFRGFDANGGTGHRIRSSIAVGGDQEGFHLSAGTTVSHCASLGNAHAGFVNFTVDGTELDRVSVFGNGLTLDINCGITSPPAVRRVFFGDPAGPGADPADLLCPADPIGPDTVSKKEIRVRLRPLR
jgi:hypothetical protein